MADLTADRLQELRRIAEAATPGPWTSPWEQKDGFDPEEYGFYGASGDKIVGLLWYDGWHLECSEENARHIATFDPTTVLALLDEIERLRRERETLAAAVRAWDDYAKTIIENGPLAFDAIDAMERAEQRHREALALLDGEKGGGDDGR